ncbi:MAG TPA: hypothetical protein VG294_04665 [Solirubrobacteraceae bacterium]|jgi:hypothetical protein|nr:hypothetical protein [Solirubrobacteraceae bacterium]
MILFAHLGHWYSAFGFLVPAALVIAWIRLQARRDRRRAEFAEYWTLRLRDGCWVLVSTAPAPLERKRGRAAAGTAMPSPWSRGQDDSERVGDPEPGGGNGAKPFRISGAS